MRLGLGWLGLCFLAAGSFRLAALLLLARLLIGLSGLLIGLSGLLMCGLLCGGSSMWLCWLSYLALLASALLELGSSVGLLLHWALLVSTGLCLSH